MQTNLLTEDGTFCLGCDYHFLKGDSVACGYLQVTGKRRGHPGGRGCPHYIRREPIRSAAVHVDPEALDKLRRCYTTVMLSCAAEIGTSTAWRIYTTGKVSVKMAERIQATTGIDLRSRAVPQAAIPCKDPPSPPKARGRYGATAPINAQAMEQLKTRFGCNAMALAAGTSVNAIYIAGKKGRMTLQMADKIRDRFGIDPVLRKPK